MDPSLNRDRAAVLGSEEMDSRTYAERFDRILMMALRERGMTLAELADVLDTTRQRLYFWRTGRTAPTILDLYAISAALKLDLTYFTEPPAIPPTPEERKLSEALRRGLSEFPPRG